MDYIEFDFTITPKESGTEILAAVLAEVGFESFVETDTGLLAYIPDSKYSPEAVENLDILQNREFSIQFSFKSIEDRNWNAEWEKNYNPVVIADKCCVRAPFHPKDETCKYDIIIEPKMSFGTAHHETTSLMIEQIMSLDLKGRIVLDMGCGTAVLAILASKMGASSVTAIDNDEWAYNNSVENVERNCTENIEVIMGDAGSVKEMYDVIFANINRNILMHDIPEYVSHLKNSGIILLSGFYEADMPLIIDKAETSGINFLSSSVKNNWVVLKFIKQ
jgi:ribosomal protein L11 methyltransferase